MPKAVRPGIVREIFSTRLAPFLRPGIHCARALTEGEPLEGTWFDRTQESAARRRGESVEKYYKYATAETVVLDPLPCWSHLPVEEQRRRAASLIEGINEKAGDTAPPFPAGCFPPALPFVSG